MTTNRYAHLRQCSFNFEPLYESNEVELSYDMIYNGCSADEPYTLLSETRDTFEWDSFGKILFINDDFKSKKLRLSCIVDACMPPDMGKNFSILN